MQGVGDGAVLDPQRQVGHVDLQGPPEAAQHGLGVLPHGAVTLQLVGVQLLLDAAGPRQSHARPRVEPAPGG